MGVHKMGRRGALLLALLGVVAVTVCKVSLFSGNRAVLDQRRGGAEVNGYRSVLSMLPFFKKVLSGLNKPQAQLSSPRHAPETSGDVNRVLAEAGVSRRVAGEVEGMTDMRSTLAAPRTRLAAAPNMQQQLMSEAGIGRRTGHEVEAQEDTTPADPVLTKRLFARLDASTRGLLQKWLATQGGEAPAAEGATRHGDAEQEERAVPAEAEQEEERAAPEARDKTGGLDLSDDSDRELTRRALQRLDGSTREALNKWLGLNGAATLSPVGEEREAVAVPRDARAARFPEKQDARGARDAARFFEEEGARAAPQHQPLQHGEEATHRWEAADEERARRVEAAGVARAGDAVSRDARATHRWEAADEARARKVEDAGAAREAVSVSRGSRATHRWEADDEERARKVGEARKRLETRFAGKEAALQRGD
ncbi:hypothetical protein T484DRAFT_1877043 [Baffinella frigidus]|nr:hypothetical protein T484DRAFT_1877043 [Cryptophyta sp. CCMP2293]